MKRRTTFIAMLGAVLLITILVLAGTVHDTVPTPRTWAKVAATKQVVACTTENKSIVLPTAIRNEIETNALLYINDVPAGTNVNVVLSSYSATHVTGTDNYPTKYGSYAFAMDKSADGWKFNSFKHCY